MCDYYVMMENRDLNGYLFSYSSCILKASITQPYTCLEACLPVWECTGCSMHPIHVIVSQTQPLLPIGQLCGCIAPMYTVCTQGCAPPTDHTFVAAALSVQLLHSNWPACVLHRTPVHPYVGKQQPSTGVCLYTLHVNEA